MLDIDELRERREREWRQRVLASNRRVRRPATAPDVGARR
jgi:hypothetical protein